jgi:Ca-activated chloride channel family protein
MLIDVSDSMRGKKIIGAIEAALALKSAIRKNSYDELHVVAFNHNVRVIRENEILNLDARGRTDIGLALRKAREILKDKKGSRVVFLITDGEPTSSYNPYLTPWKCAIKEAENLRLIDAHLTIVMLGKDRKFLELCNRMARASGKSHILFFADPLDLKRFFVRSYLKKRSANR